MNWIDETGSRTVRWLGHSLARWHFIEVNVSGATFWQFLWGMDIWLNVVPLIKTCGAAAVIAILSVAIFAWWRGQ